jgi:DNA primase
MARLPDEQVARLKQDVSLLRLVQSQGYAPVRQGKDWLMRCPFHDDKTPSLVISEHNNLWHCLGACGVGGSVIDWVMKTQGVSFRYACEILQHNVELVAGTHVTKQATAKKLTSPLAADADDQALLHQVVDYYHTTLKESPEALVYLKTRGLDNAELIERFKLGYANRTLGYRLPEKNRKAGAEVRGRLQALGVLRDSGHEHFNGSLVVPVINGGAVMEMYGRKILDNLRAGTAYHLYLPGGHAGVWNVDALQSSTEIILCESLIDAMTFWVHGFKNVTASYGVNGFTADHLAAFKQHGTQRVLIAYDRDDAGNAAAEALAKTLTADGIECFRVLFPKGMDANDYALKMSPPQKALELVIRKAEWMGGGKPPPRDPETKKTAAKEKTAPVTSPLAATPMPTAPAVVEAIVNDNEVELTQQGRHYRVRGLPKHPAQDSLKVNVRVSDGAAFHIDTFDLYSARQRAGFITQVANELCVSEETIKTDLAQLLLQLEAVQDARSQQTLDVKSTEVALTDTEHAAAMDLLRDPSLLSRLLTDFAVAGVVGEETNKLVAYLACVSRLLEKPLAVMIQSSSAAGKSSLMDAVLALMPEDARVQYSAMTGQSLFYMGATSLKNKILAIAEEEGAHNASYALKLLQSEGEVTIASTGKDENTGNLVTRDYTVEGPVMLLMTTTAIDIDEELMNRCLVLSVNESREQTAAIHRAQRQKRTLAGLHTKLEKERVLTLHRHAQRLLRPLAIINPYADQLTFLDDKTRTRRDHEKYLTLIDSIALLHQHQRESKTIEHNGQRIEYIEVTLADIDIANRLAHDVLGKTLDELPPQTRKLLTLMDACVQERCVQERMERRHFRFSRKAVRAWCGWSDTQVRVHLDRLTQLEYVLVHRGSRGQSFEYELLYDGEGDSGSSFLMGLLDVAQLQQAESKNAVTTQSSRGDEAGFAASTRAHHGTIAAPVRTAEITKSPVNPDENAESLPLNGKIHSTPLHRPPSYRSHTRVVVGREG